MNKTMTGVRFDTTGNLIKPKIPKKLRTQFDKPTASDLSAMLKAQEVKLKNGTHLLCRFCGCSYLKAQLRYMFFHIKRSHKAEFVSWYIGTLLVADAEREQHGQDDYPIEQIARVCDTATYELNQVL